MLTQARVKYRRELLNKLLLFANLTQSNLINIKNISYRKSSKLKKNFIMRVPKQGPLGVLCSEAY